MRDPFAVPVVEVEPQEDPPIVVLVHGPPGVGKSTLIQVHAALLVLPSRRTCIQDGFQC